MAEEVKDTPAQVFMETVLTVCEKMCSHKYIGCKKCAIKKLDDRFWAMGIDTVGTSSIHRAMLNMYCK